MKNNIHIFQCPTNETKKVLLLSDLHWDNPKCDRDLLKKHLDLALKGGNDILLNGDTFCLMQGAYDPRKSKQDIRPEHNVNNYLDAVVNDAIEWFKPYAHLIKVVGYGNHETNIIKRQETDVIQRFVFGLNRECNTSIQCGGYGGWVVYQFVNSNKIRGAFKIKYFHGSGGGGAVTKGVIQFNRMSTFVQDADLIWMGHVHECNEVVYTTEYLDQFNNIKLKNILMVRTATYKEEYNNGRGGWHVERGATPKPLGGRWLEINLERKVKDNKELVNLNAFTYRV
jgi:hypothetical protein